MIDLGRKIILKRECYDKWSKAKKTGLQEEKEPLSQQDGDESEIVHCGHLKSNLPF